PAALAEDWRALGALPFRAALEGVRLDERAERLRDFLLAADPDVATRLFQLVVATRCAQPEGPEIEQRLELVQMSADTRTKLDPERSLAADKLTGMQWHHFGAFYKQSWRASDWMWGRVDG